MKRFFISFLGSMAALWVTAIIAVLGLVALVAAIGANGASQGKSDVKKHSALLIDLSTDIDERGGSLPSLQQLVLGGGIETGQSLETMVNAILAAATDDKIEGIYIEGGEGEIGAAQANALIAALKNFKASGKWVYSYADVYSQLPYMVATVADSIFINPESMIYIHGLGSEINYYKDFLDKVGINVEVVRVGTYKSAVEPFMLPHMSEAAREQITAYITSLWGDMVSTIAINRNVTPEEVNAWADSVAFFSGSDYYIKHGLADKTLYRRQMTDRLRELTKVDDADDDPRLVTVSEYSASKQLTGKSVSGKHIAVLYAVGEITESGREGIVSDDLVPQIESLANDDDVAGLVLRVNSPGGSAFASEQIWEALRSYVEKTGNPFYVSMSDYAASGGYYISCGADRIYAEPLTITGSIGIFGMIPNATKLFNDKLGIHSDGVYTNPGASMPGLTAPMDPKFRAAMQGYVNRGYDTFTKRVAQGRGISQDSVKVIAEGRVWDGRAALRLGLVDCLGGLDRAIADMALELDMDPSQIKSYPEDKNDWIYQLMSLTSTIEERCTARTLGAAYPLWKQMRDLQDASTLQTRMEGRVVF